jgi:hypothetical protein
MDLMESWSGGMFMSSVRQCLLLCVTAAILCSTNPALAKSAAKQTQPSSPPATQGSDTAIPLPKDLTDNSDPFNASSSSAASSGQRYFQQQQNFREQDPVRDQEGDRIIRQFE